MLVRVNRPFATVREEHFIGEKRECIPVSTCDEISTQKPWVFALWKFIILTKKITMAAPQKTGPNVI